MTIRRVSPAELTWLVRVQKSHHPLSLASPIWVRWEEEDSDLGFGRPEVHPYCEAGVILEGGGPIYVEREDARRHAGDVLLLGPGVPHWTHGRKPPRRFITVYFLPKVLLDIAPEGDGSRLLRRFMDRSALTDRLLRPPASMRTGILRRFEQLKEEFRGAGFGRQVKLHVSLLDLLVELFRWEGDSRPAEEPFRNGRAWHPIDKALGYLREHFADKIYAADVAAASGISQSQLRGIFQETLGMTWTHYLNLYRIEMAAAGIREPGSNISEVAFAVGFQSLSHFNATFRSIMEMSPSEYATRAESSR